MNLSQSFGNTHKPTLAWGVSISTVLLIVAVVVVLVWITKHGKAAS